MHGNLLKTSLLKTLSLAFVVTAALVQVSAGAPDG